MTISNELRAQVRSGENEVLSYYLGTAKELLGEIIPSETLVNVFTRKEWGRRKQIDCFDDCVKERFQGGGERFVGIFNWAGRGSSLSINVDDIQGLGLQGECFYFRGGIKIRRREEDVTPAIIRGDVAGKVMEELVTQKNGFTLEAQNQAREEAKKMAEKNLIDFSLTLGFRGEDNLPIIIGKIGDFSFFNLN